MPITSAIYPKLQKAAGEGVDVSKHAVFEATALNTQPVRKDHPLYKGGRHTKSYLKQMADAVNGESLPLQVMHSRDVLPAGRVFDGAVVDLDTGPELRVLFWVAPTYPQLVEDLNNGTIDQVSVSTVAKDPVCSECGFNFLGPDADFDLIFSGTCGNGHKIGHDGAHVKMSNLDQWFEMSLVGRGGATGARIVSPKNAVLTATGKDAPPLTLTLSNSDLEPVMDLKDLVAKLDALGAQIATLSAATPKGSTDPDTNTPAVGDLATLAQRIGDLEKKMTEVTKAPTPPEPKAKTDDAGNFLLSGFNDLAKQILVMSGDVEAKVPEDAKAALELVTTKLAGLGAKTAAGAGAALEAAAGSGGAGAKPTTSISAFKSAR